MDQARVAEIVREADELLEADPESFDSSRFDQPGGTWVREAQDLLGDDAPWHQVAMVANALAHEERDEEAQ